MLLVDTDQDSVLFVYTIFVYIITQYDMRTPCYFKGFRI